MPDTGTPSLNQPIRSLREVRDDLASRIRRIEADGYIDDPLAELLARLKFRLAAVKAELRDRQAKGEDI